MKSLKLKKYLENLEKIPMLHMLQNNHSFLMLYINLMLKISKNSDLVYCDLAIMIKVQWLVFNFKLLWNVNSYQEK